MLGADLQREAWADYLVSGFGERDSDVSREDGQNVWGQEEEQQQQQQQQSDDEARSYGEEEEEEEEEEAGFDPAAARDAYHGKRSNSLSYAGVSPTLRCHAQPSPAGCCSSGGTQPWGD